MAIKNNLRAFHNNPKIKEKYIARVKEHARLDQIAKGVYYENINGKIRACGVGCTIEGSNHDAYETELGIPSQIAHLEDTIFENLPNELAMKFPLRFLEAVPVGADLSKVIAQFVIWQFEDEKVGLKNIQEVIDDKEVYGFCEEVVALYKRILNGEQPTEDEFYDLYLKIDVTWAWARAGAGARAGAWARAWAEAWAGAYEQMADKLIELLENAPVE